MKAIIAATLIALAICAHPFIEFRCSEHSKKEAIKVEVEARQLAEKANISLPAARVFVNKRKYKL
jgi:hypothetical protein